MSGEAHGSEARPRWRSIKLVDAYEKFVRDADQYRLGQSHPHEQLDQLMKDHEMVKQRAEDVRRALDKMRPRAERKVRLLAAT